jgi:ubiquinone/menaquinone biosynthesis C-methylase UbiE
MGFQSLVGLDLSVNLLESAMKSVLSCWPDVPMVRGDMLALPFSDRCFDYVVNFFTSFGYFETEEENARVLSEAGRVLRPGGRFWLDYLNPAFVKKTLVPESAREVEGITVRESRTLSNDGTRLRKTIELTRAGETRSYLESVRLYDREELETMLCSAGLKVVEAFGDYEPIEISSESPRMILVGEKSPERRRCGR